MNVLSLKFIIAMTDLFTLIDAIRWPTATVLAIFLLSRALIVVARTGIRVEIFTRRPILVGTGQEPLKAEVGKVRI